MKNCGWQRVSKYLLCCQISGIFPMQLTCKSDRNAKHAVESTEDLGNHCWDCAQAMQSLRLCLSVTFWMSCAIWSIFLQCETSSVDKFKRSASSHAHWYSYISQQKPNDGIGSGSRYASKHVQHISKSFNPHSTPSHWGCQILFPPAIAGPGRIGSIDLRGEDCLGGTNDRRTHPAVKRGELGNELPIPILRNKFKLEKKTIVNDG